METILDTKFFDQDACELAQSLLGKVISHFVRGTWLRAQIIETEAYFLEDKASHASLGYTEKRKALFMPAGTIYMYYARGGDSLNLSAQGAGNAVLIKSGIVFPFEDPDPEKIRLMQTLNPLNKRERAMERLCSGQTLFCKSLGLRVKDWDQKQFEPKKFYCSDHSYTPQQVIQTQRLGIPKGRDEHLPYRFIDAKYLKFCTKKPVLDLPTQH